MCARQRSAIVAAGGAQGSGWRAATRCTVSRSKGETAMSTEANKALVQRLLAEGFNGGNMALFDELLAPDFVNHDPSSPAVDRKGFKQWWMALRTAFPDMHTE